MRSDQSDEVFCGSDDDGMGADSDHSAASVTSTRTKTPKKGRKSGGEVASCSSKASGVKKKIQKEKEVPIKHQCFVARCAAKKKTGSKCCSPHMKDLGALRYQADKKKESALMLEIEADPVRLEGALAEFARINPPGKFRKDLVDWSMFRKTFSVTKANTDRQREEEYSWEDWEDEKKAAGCLMKNTSFWIKF